MVRMLVEHATKGQGVVVDRVASKVKDGDGFEIWLGVTFLATEHSEYEGKTVQAVEYIPHGDLDFVEFLDPGLLMALDEDEEDPLEGEEEEEDLDEEEEA
jgi:hypothetical protein